MQGILIRSARTGSSDIAMRVALFRGESRFGEWFSLYRGTMFMNVLFMTGERPRKRAIHRADYRRLAAIRHALRHFLAISETAAREAGITPQQHQALLAIKGAIRPGDITVGYLAEQLLLKPNSAAELVDRMVRCELLVRTGSKTDRRRVVLYLTPTAEKVLHSLSAAHFNELRGSIAVFDLFKEEPSARRDRRRTNSR
jgi:DNA-binding MarR family transcriptional regulator